MVRMPSLMSRNFFVPVHAFSNHDFSFLFRKGASTGDIIVEQINNVGAYDVQYRYENWIFVNGGEIKESGWMYFDESYVN
ncbi:hypothetical protein [Bacillus cereus group sp. BfR-BA-01380]|uniref:hypothetical protein n=1 Tax=Bacillus cereus group sp. BfR-BA-01380 TaxID=2920324 RepID=UPI001F57BB54|nr:hypothetical protein [Bacillus cereus group sp. BfR-BA-01380]